MNSQLMVLLSAANHAAAYPTVTAIWWFYFVGVFVFLLLMLLVLDYSATGIIIFVSFTHTSCLFQGDLCSKRHHCVYTVRLGG